MSSNLQVASIMGEILKGHSYLKESSHSPTVRITLKGAVGSGSIVQWLCPVYYAADLREVSVGAMVMIL